AQRRSLRSLDVKKLRFLPPVSLIVRRRAGFIWFEAPCAQLNKPFHVFVLALVLALLMRRFRGAVGFRIRQSAVRAETRSFAVV
ncbi:hypothetical protein, partial [Atopomonas hussainii]|uniref:hypothetical protein n=1 Tax=Atopomonas hussainii TaxID=1429083 RepID=UPI001C3199C0